MATRAHNTPRRAKSGSSVMLSTEYCGISKAGWSPRKRLLTTVAQNEETTTGAKAAAPQSLRTSSRAKNAPATGALNVPATPAAAPQATITRVSLLEKPSSCATVDPAADPIWTIGPSRPTEPPEPMQMLDASAFTSVTRGLMRPPRMATASMTSGTPCPLASRANRYTMGPTSAPPTAGMAR